jgi:hypothetical protein
LTLVVLVILAACWAVVLVPPLLRARTERSTDPITDFNFRLGVLGRTNGSLDMARSPKVRESRTTRATQRRRLVLQILAGGVAVTLLTAYVTEAPIFWALQVVADLLLVTFLALWAYVRSLRMEHAVKVREIPQHAQRRTPELAWRRAASS